MPTFPRFAIFYADGAVVRGGGSDEEMVTLTVPRSWFEAPADGVVVVNVESPRLGRRTLKDADAYYSIPSERVGGPDVGMSAPETGVWPFVQSLGLVKRGLWVCDDLYNTLMGVSSKDGHVSPMSANSSREKVPHR